MIPCSSAMGSKHLRSFWCWVWKTLKCRKIAVHAELIFSGRREPFFGSSALIKVSSRSLTSAHKNRDLQIRLIVMSIWWISGRNMNRDWKAPLNESTIGSYWWWRAAIINNCYGEVFSTTKFKRRRFITRKGLRWLISIIESRKISHSKSLAQITIFKVFYVHAFLAFSNTPSIHEHVFQ